MIGVSFVSWNYYDVLINSQCSQSFYFLTCDVEFWWYSLSQCSFGILDGVTAKLIPFERAFSVCLSSYMSVKL